MKVKSLLLLWFSALAAGAAAEDGVLTYSANPQYPPYHWAVGDDRLAGASVELLKLLLPPGVRAQPLVVPWKRALDLAAQGEVDLLLSLRITPERQQFLQFVPHRAFPNPIVVFVLQGAPLKLRSWDDLKAEVGGVSAGDFFGGGFDEYWRANLRVETADSMVENFRKLDTGRIGWFVTSLYAGKAYLAAHPTGHPVTVLDPPISQENIHFGFSAKSPWVKLIPQLNRRLEELDRGGFLEGLLQRSLAGDF